MNAAGVAPTPPDAQDKPSLQRNTVSLEERIDDTRIRECRFAHHGGRAHSDQPFVRI
jgi:hypothetical protein